MNSGIYIIKSTTNDKSYIGSTVDFKDRFYRHKRHLKLNKHKNSHLQNYYNKHGEGSLVFDILEYCDPTILIEREQHYMDTLLPKFNIHKIADRPVNVKRTEATKQKISKNKSIVVYQYDLNGDFIREWKSATFAAKILKCSSSGIGKCCSGNFKSFFGFMWSYKKLDGLEPYDYPHQVKICQYDKNFKLINTYNSIKEAAKALDTSASHISGFLTGKNKTVKGFYFYPYSENISTLKDIISKRIVNVYDSSNTVIYAGLASDVAKKFKIFQGYVYIHLKNGKPYNGLFFKYTVT